MSDGRFDEANELFKQLVHIENYRIEGAKRIYSILRALRKVLNDLRIIEFREDPSGNGLLEKSRTKLEEFKKNYNTIKEIIKTFQDNNLSINTNQDSLFD